MGAVWMCARVELRRRWVSAVVLTIVIGLAGAVVLTATAGARRTSSSFDRFLVESHASDVYVFPGEVTPDEVRDFARPSYIEAVAAAQTLQVQLPDGEFPNAGAPVDDRFGVAVERPRIIEGRAADPRAADEIVLPEPRARQQHLRVGDTLRVRSFSPAQVDELKSGALDSFPKPGGPTVPLHVVGISRLPSDLSLAGAQGGILLLTRAFGERYASQIGSFSGDVLSIRLRDGAADLPRLVQRARRFFGDAESFDVQPLGESTAGVQQSIDVLALGALLFAAFAAVAGLTAVGLALRRRMDADLDDELVLRSLGVTHAGRALIIGLPTVPIVLAGALVAVAGAWLASPLMPMGLGRKAEPHPGLHFDGLVLGIGFAAIVVGLALMAGLVAWRTARVVPDVDRAASRPSIVARASERAGLTPTVSIGTRLALEGRSGRSGVPVRSALIGTVAAVVGVVSVMVFGASLDRLETTPALFGFNWDARVIDGATRPAVADHPCTVKRSRLTAVRGVGDVASVCSLNTEVGGRPIVAFGLTSIRGAIEPTIVEGRAPRTAREVALGTKALSALGKQIGDHVQGSGPNGPVEFRIVGTAAAPRFNDAFSDPVPVDDGAFFTGAGLDALDDPNDADSNAETLLRVAPGAERSSVLHRVERLHGIAGFDGGPGVATAATPLEVERLQEVDSLPVVLAAFLGLLGVVSVGFVLASSVRRRRRDLAILKTLGFSRRQVSATVGWQATTVALVGLAVGLPVGVIVGRLIWRSVADGLGVVSTPETPFLLLLAVGVVTVMVANLIAAVPARVAARTQPARVLRSE